MVLSALLPQTIVFVLLMPQFRQQRPGGTRKENLHSNTCYHLKMWRSCPGKPNQPKCFGKPRIENNVHQIS